MEKAIILIGIPKNAEKKDGFFVMPKDTYPTVFYFELPKQIWLFFVKHLEDFVDGFVKGSDSGGKIPKAFFKLLADNIESVLEDFSKAPDLLPVLDNEYIYDPTDFDERYFLELERTSKDIKKILAAFDFEKYNVYYIKTQIH